MLTALLAAAALGASGLKIENLAPGSGEAARDGDFVTVDYTGRLTNGTQFDSSIGREPFGFILGAGMVIKGWDQGVKGMKVGGKRRLTIPPALGYGASGTGPIPPNATLVFEVEMKKIERVKTEVLKKGTGSPAKMGDTILVHYTGTLANGTKFDSSRDRGQPFEVTLGQSRLINGFTMGLMGIRVGERRKVTIPASLGYGARAMGPIPANSTLIFDRERVRG